jgi:hypothetical protein
MYFRLYPSTIRIEEIGFGLLPTPSCMQMDYQPKEGWTWEGNYWRDQNGKKKQTDLTTSVKMNGLLPTPMASDCGEKVTGLESQDLLVKMTRVLTGTTSQLNPRFVLEMMGFPPDWTELPFLNGATNPSKLEETQ